MVLAGPMQSWGTQSHFTNRDTGREPSKSGVVGLVCAALGRDRAAPIDDLARLRFGVRVDRDGVVRRDYHTASDVLRANGDQKPTEVSHRFYLADAVFLAAFEGPEDLVRRLQFALEHPVWPLFLGRKAFVPSRPVAIPDGVRLIGLEEALRTSPSADPLDRRVGPRRARLVLEDPVGSRVQVDQPISFAHAARRFAPRRVRVEECLLPDRSGEVSDAVP
jgi:CRISPR system Cascade subunit CasD